MLSGPMLGAALIAITLLGPLASVPLGPRVSAPSFLASLPDEPGAAVLTDASTVQAVVADLDGDGVREIVALTTTEDGSVAVEGWAEALGSWAPIGAPVPVPPEGAQPGPLRLIVRETEDGERVTLARQPLVPGASAGQPCCLHLEDVVVRGAALRLEPVADAVDATDALFALDLDGDGVDELVGTRSLSPLGDISYPTAVTIHAWNGDAFLPPFALELPVGSGDTPFMLGDSDGVPGEELGIIATIGRPAFHRVAFEGGRSMRVEDAHIAPLPVDVSTVPSGAGTAIVLLYDDGTLELRSWPANEPIGAPVSRARARFAGSILGEVEVAGRSFVALRQATGADALHLRELPALTVPPAAIAPVAPAAPAFTGMPVLPYVGPLPGGGTDGSEAIIVAGRLVSGADGSVARIGLLAGAAPVGLAGSDRRWLVIQHLPAVAPTHPSGGRLDLVQAPPGSGLTVAPLDIATRPEEGDATVELSTTGGIPGRARSLDVGPGGFGVVVEAPPGSRILVAGLDPTVVAAVQIVRPDGRAEVPMVPPVTGIPNPRYRAAMSITTPAGHSYAATWDVRVTTEPPPIEATVTTPIGSGTVIVSGSTAVGSAVSIDGRSVPTDVDGAFEAGVPVPPWPTDVVIKAIGPFGAESREVLSAVGFVDYRSLPWVPIVAAALALVAVLLAVRVPQRSAAPRRADDDAQLEELDAD
jgi:hypothetical protein